MMSARCGCAPSPPGSDLLPRGFFIQDTARTTTSPCSARSGLLGVAARADYFLAGAGADAAGERADRCLAPLGWITPQAMSPPALPAGSDL